MARTPPHQGGEERLPLQGLLISGGELRELHPTPTGCGLCTRKVRALPMALTALVLVAGVRQFAGPQRSAEAQPPPQRAKTAGGVALWAASTSGGHGTGHGDVLDAASEDHEVLGNSQFTDEEAAEKAAEDCHTAKPGDHCFNAVHFAMHDGIKFQPSWYPGLTASSSFKEFQIFLHEEGRSSCDIPCDDEGHAAKTTPAPDHGGGHGEEGEQGHGGHEAGHVHGYLCLCFLLGGLSIGCVLQVVQERLMPCIPYTCLLFIMGVILAGIHELRPEGHWSSWPTWYISVAMWENVDPHLIFYVFLPVLVFAEAMRLNIKLAMKLFSQVLLLAVPGVMMGTGLTAVFSKYVLPYSWSWATCLVFGAILAATDPVAVVALFNTLGVSPRLTMLISGESLLNDGTAIVLFTLTLQLMLGHSVTPAGFAQFFLQMTVLSVLLGIALAAVALYLISKCAETKYHSDPMIQVCVTICLSMLCFFIAESEVHTSGVLTVVTAGCVFSHYAWPRFASRETMHIVWEAIEFLGNTVIFLLAGLLFGHRCITRQGHLEYKDFGWLILLYLAVTAIRASMVLVLWPLMNCIGEPITWKEALVMTWSGLRGAVGLVLAIVVDEEPSIAPQIGSHFMFHIGGIAMLTIMVNATLCAPLLRSLGLTTPPEIDHRTAEHFENMTHEDARQAFNEVKQQNSKEGDPRWAGADMDAVKAMLPSLSAGAHSEGHGSGGERDEASELRVYRETFARFVQSAYWNDIEEGLIPRTSRIARVLLFSTSSVLQTPFKKLDDWKVIVGMSEDFQLCPCLNRCIGSCWPFSEMTVLQGAFPADHTVEMWNVYLALCFIDAHKSAREELPAYFSDGDVLSTSVQEQVARESQEETEEAAKFLEGLSSEAVVHGKNRMLAGKLLHGQMSKVADLAKKGVLADKGAAHIMHHLQAEHRSLAGSSMLRHDQLQMPLSKKFF